MARDTGPDCRRCRREKMKLFLKGSKCESAEVPDRDPAVPAGRARPRPHQGLASTCSSCARSRRPAGCTACWRSSSAATTPRPTARPAGPARCCCRSSSRGWTTWSTGPASPRPGTPPASSSGTATCWSTARRSTSRRTGSARDDIVEVREKSWELTPFVVARAQAGSRPVPAWLEVISSRMRILVHSLPARQVIDTPVQEQLIVEFYSK